MKEHNAKAHGHVHAHAHEGDASVRSLTVALAITGLVFIAELVGGWLSGSMALLADAMHMLSDATGMIIALVAVLIGKREVSRYATFGYRRAEVLAAAINAVTVGLISIWIVYAAISRLANETEIASGTMMGVAFIGLVANVASALVLHRQRGESINVEGAYLHVLVDLAGSVAVIVAGAVIALTGFQAADVIASLVIAGMVLPRAWGLLKSSTSVLLERVPEGIDPDAVGDELLALDGVEGIHDLHLWSMSGNNVLCTVHVMTRGDNGILLDRAQAKLADIGIDHATIQIEHPDHAEHEIFCGPDEAHEKI